MNNVIKTKRLRIRLSSDIEMEELIANEKDQGMKQAYTEMLNASISNPLTRKWYATWIIELSDNDNQRIGNLCFKGLDMGAVEIGYGLNNLYWGQGYATEAVRAMIEWVKSQDEVNKIEAESETDNIASIRVLEKSGFELNGVQGEEGPRFEYKGL